MSERRVWKCRDCRKQFSVLTGTMMHATKIPVRTWVLVIFDMMSAKNGISGPRGRAQVRRVPSDGLAHAPPHPSSGDGGQLIDHPVRAPSSPMRPTSVANPKNRHASQARAVRSMGGTDKTPVVSIIDAVTGEVRSHVVTW